MSESTSSRAHARGTCKRGRHPLRLSLGVLVPPPRPGQNMSGEVQGDVMNYDSEVQCEIRGEVQEWAGRAGEDEEGLHGEDVAQYLRRAQEQLTRRWVEEWRGGLADAWAEEKAVEERMRVEELEAQERHRVEVECGGEEELEALERHRAEVTHGEGSEMWARGRLRERDKRTRGRLRQEEAELKAEEAEEAQRRKAEQKFAMEEKQWVKWQREEGGKIEMSFREWWDWTQEGRERYQQVYVEWQREVHCGGMRHKWSFRRFWNWKMEEAKKMT